MKSKDLERIIELSSREVTDEEGIEHFNLKNKLELQLEKLEKVKNWYARTQGQVRHESALEMIKILESKQND